MQIPGPHTSQSYCAKIWFLNKHPRGSAYLAVRNNTDYSFGLAFSICSYKLNAILIIWTQATQRTDFWNHNIHRIAWIRRMQVEEQSWSLMVKERRWSRATCVTNDECHELQCETNDVAAASGGVSQITQGSFCQKSLLDTWFSPSPQKNFSGWMGFNISRRRIWEWNTSLKDKQEVLVT